MRIVIATGNPHKVDEIRAVLAPMGFTVVALPELEQRFRPESVKDPQPEIHLRPDRRARYDVVAKVLATAQRNRMTKIGFVNTAEFAGEE